MLQQHVDKIIRLQAIWRGKKVRENFKIMRMQSRAGSRYFTLDESRETLSGNPFNPN